MRYHITNFAAIRASTHRGCTLCSILYRGMNLFWKGPWKGVASDSKGEDENKKAGDDVQEGKLPHYIFLRLRPGKPLLLFRQSQIPDGGKPYFKGIHTELEFFTEISMSPSTHATTLDTDFPSIPLDYPPRLRPRPKTTTTPNPPALHLPTHHLASNLRHITHPLSYSPLHSPKTPCARLRTPQTHRNNRPPLLKIRNPKPLLGSRSQST